MGCFFRKWIRKEHQAMDLNSLPDELMAGILKYCEQRTVFPMRKISSRFDTISKKYGVGRRVPVAHLTFEKGAEELTYKITVETDKRTWKYLGIPPHKSGNAFVCDKQSPEIFSELSYILGMIKVTDSALFGIYDDTIVAELLTLLCKANNVSGFVRKENITNNLSKLKMRRLLMICKQADVFTFAGSDGIDVICNTETLANRKWKQLFFCPDAPINYTGIDKCFLYEVVRNCQKFMFVAYFVPNWGITMMDLLDFIEDCHQNKKFFKKQKWLFSVISQGNLAIAKVNERLRQFTGMKYNHVSVPEGFLSPISPALESFDITMPRRKKMNITIWMERKRAQEIS